MVNAQAWLESQEKYNTKEKRAETKELYIRHQDLEGDLNLSDFVNLEKLDCSHNQITHLEITDCTNLKKLDCSNNQLTNLDLTNNKKLEILDIRINNFSKKQDLTFLSHLVNLESLWLGNDTGWKVGQGTCNYFTGSLEFLKNLNKLKKLDIDGTDIDSGLEYLPNSIEKFYCAPRKREEAKVRTIHIFFADEQGIVREEGDGYIVNFPRKLQDFKKWQEKGFTNEQRKEAGLKLEEWTFADYIKEKGCDISNTDKIEELIKEYRQAQTWLDWNYSAEKRNEITELDISSKELEGDLSLENFTKLQKLNCANNQINRLDLSKSEQLVEVDCSMNKLIEINLKNSKNLLNLYCNDNQLTNLDLSSCENLESLKVHNSYNEEEREWFNELSDISFLNKLPNPEKLKVLRLDANNVSSNLEPFSGFINLEDLGLGMNGYSKETTKKRGNKFYGSLEPLKNLNKLKKLDIANTDIDSGFEHLPASVEEICCSSKERSESKVKKIADDPKLNHLFDLNGNKYTRNWKDIHADFTPQLQKLWKEHAFTKEQVKKWIEIGLQPNDYDLANHLKNQGINAEQKDLDLVNLKSNYEEKPDWKNIHKYLDDFWREYWEKGEFNYAETKQWIEAWISYSEYEKAKEWKDLNFSPVQTQKWLEAGLKTKDSKFANYLRKNNFTPNQYAKQSKNAQEWLNCFYPSEKRENVTEMDITDKGLEGSLKIDGFSNLEKINCSSNELVNLEVINLKSSKEINCSNNKLAGLKVNGLDNLEVLNCSENCLTDVETLLSDLSHEKLKTLNLSNNNFSKNDLSPFSKFTNLENLYLSTTDKKGIEQGSYNKFFGSLESLKNLTKLKKLDIVNTDINSGVEYLPGSLEKIIHTPGKWEKERPEAKVNEIKKELDNQLTKIWLDKNYPKEKRKETKELSAGFKRLRGELDLSGFENLEALDCHDNELTGLNLSKCNNLQSLKVNRNKLSDINFLNQIRSPEKLKVLHLGDNRIFSDLSPFSRFINLEDLGLGSDERFSDKEDLNNFFGSLVPLKNLTNLEVLNISDTDISDDNLENLPDNLIRIYCSSEEKTESKVKKLEDLLKKSDNFILSSKPDDFSLWDKTEVYVRKYSNAQEWLNKRYSDKEKVKEINLSSLEDIECQQESGLSIENFPNLKEIKYSSKSWNGTEKVNKITIKGCSRLEKIDIGNFEENREVIISNCQELKELDCSNSQLTSLNLEDCSQLTKLNCSNNSLKELNVQPFPNLKELNCSKNDLAGLELSENLQLEQLNITDSNFSEQNLIFLEKLTNLQTLKVGNSDIKELHKLYEEHNNNKYSGIGNHYFRFAQIFSRKFTKLDNEIKRREQGKYNKFNGSLEFLKNMSKLKTLDISNTDINEGVKYLPDSVSEIYYSFKDIPESKVKEIAEELKCVDTWIAITPDFTIKNKKDWESKGFSYEETDGWISGWKLKEREIDWARYLKAKVGAPWWNSSWNIDELRDKLRNEFKNYLEREEKKIRDKQNEETNKEDSQQENERKDDSSTSKKTDDYSTHVAKSQKLTSTKNEVHSSAYSSWGDINSDFKDSDFVDYLKGKDCKVNDLLVSDVVKWNRDYHNEKIKVSVEKDVVDEGITDRELNQALIDNKCITNKNQTWQTYLDNSKTPDELSIREKTILTTIKGLKEMKNKDKEIESLKSRIKELVKLVEQQKKKVVEIFLKISPERELLQGLISKYLEFIRFKKQGSEVSDYDEQCNNYEIEYWNTKSELQKKLSKEEMNKVRHILAGCEEIVQWEMELKTKVIETKKLLMLTDRKENSEFDLILESIDVPLQIEYKIDLTAQTRVDGEYPKDEKKRSEITELDISKENLQGKLNLKGFTNLKELDCHDNQLTELDISDCPNLEVLYCSSNQLSGLDLSNCPNLKTIDCGFNELTNLDLTNLSHLEELSCNDNLITKLELSSLNSEKLTSLNISDNNFSEQDLEIFGEFTNLENLLIGNEDKKKIEQGIYNRFFNSLEPLKNLTKLELLFISNTDIDSGLKFLPDSLEEIYCSFKERPESKVKTLAERLSDFSIDEDKGSYNLRDWKDSQQTQIEVQ